jgi:PAS domain S-box-containing protein
MDPHGSLIGTMNPMTSRAADPTQSPLVDEAGDLLDLLIEQVVDYAIFALDVKGNVASWNLGAQRIKGYAPVEIIGRPYELFFSEEDRAAEKPRLILAHARAHGRYYEEAWRVRKDGSRFWASICVTALHDAGGRLRGFAKITRDLSERRRAEEEARVAAAERAARNQAEMDERAVRRSRDQLDLILKHVAEGVTAQGPDGRIIYANDAAARLTGLDSAEVMLATPRDVLVGAFDVFREDGSLFPADELPGRRALRG